VTRFVYAVALALSLFPGATSVFAKDVSGIYDQGTLRQWKARYEVSTRKILDQVIWPALTPQERQQLAAARLELPLYSDYKGNPLCFYATGDGRVVMPVLSLKFLDDLCTAYAWLTTNGYGLETISEYTAMIAYKDFPTGRYPPPLSALHIPANALQDRKVDELALEHFVTARTFLLLHELGHIYYRYSYFTTEQSRRNEEQADQFAATLMRRTKLPPFPPTTQRISCELPASSVGLHFISTNQPAFLRTRRGRSSIGPKCASTSIAVVQ
jgi:hypothetical protein